MAKPKVAMIGDGNVGTALGEGLRRAGYDVKAVGKEPARVKEVASWGDVVVLAVPFGERENALREMDGAHRGKVLVDVTNAVTSEYAYAASLDESGAEALQRMADGAKVVKAFNTVFADHMSSGRVHGEPLTVFAAANDEDARRRVLDMARDIGFDAVDAGPLEDARWLEALGYWNIRLGYDLGLGPDMGFRLVHGGFARGGEAAKGARGTKPATRRT